MQTQFNSVEITLIASGLALALVSVIFRLKEKYGWAILILFLGALLLRLFATTLTDALNQWDERFHALVASNIAEHGWIPKLYTDSPLHPDATHWCCTTVWLHKPPLFLWQMALSIDIFGDTDFAVRLPSAILSALMIPMVWRTGKILSGEKAAYAAAFLLATSRYMHELISGYALLEHNDIAFITYVTASLWAFTEYTRSGKMHWALLAGLFSGGAVMVKWLAGLLVFFVWGVWLLASKEQRGVRKNYLLMAGAAALACAIVLPWYLYIFRAFPEQASAEMEHFASHFFKVVEGHKEGYWYYLERIPTQYGQLAILFLIPGLVLFFRNARSAAYRWMLLLALASGYLFFTLSATKMPNFTLLLCAFVYLALGHALDDVTGKVIHFIRNKAVAVSVVFMGMAVLAIMSFNVTGMEQFHYYKTNMTTEAQHKDVFLSIRGKFPKEKTILFFKGTKLMEMVDAMFYTDLIAYDHLPDEKELSVISQKGYRALILLTKEDDRPDLLNRLDVDVMNVDFHPFTVDVSNNRYW